MDPLNPIKPAFPSPIVRRPEDKVKRREPGTGGGLQKQDNPGGERHKPAPGDHQIDELA